jgi:hypothetical protein
MSQQKVSTSIKLATVRQHMLSYHKAVAQEFIEGCHDIAILLYIIIHNIYICVYNIYITIAICQMSLLYITRYCYVSTMFGHILHNNLLQYIYTYIHIYIYIYIYC